MHNLLLGTSKHIIDVWKSHSLLESKDLEKIQDKVNVFFTPPDIGRIPTKICSGFAGLAVEKLDDIFFFVYHLPTIAGICLLKYAIFFAAAK